MSLCREEVRSLGVTALTKGEKRYYQEAQMDEIVWEAGETMRRREQ